MWIFSKYGFYSIVRTREQRNPGEDYMIRARVRNHLETLKRLAELPNPVIRTADSDYEYRLVVSEEAYRKVMNFLEESIDYPNFKSACYAYDSRDGFWHQALHEVWAVMADLQSREIGR